jgi:hypothetical protein
MWTHSSWLRESFHWRMQARIGHAAETSENAEKELQRFRPDNWGGIWHDISGHQSLIEPAYQQFLAAAAQAPALAAADQALLKQWETDELNEKDRYVSMAVAELGEDVRPAPGTY